MVHIHFSVIMHISLNNEKKNSKSTPYRMLGECGTNSLFNGGAY